jgi:SpoVK/Ycf46/Vps4 family AAA+-type ATPase
MKEEILRHAISDTEKEIASKIITEAPNVTFEDICGLNTAKSRINQIMATIQMNYSSKLRRPPKGILLYGPSVRYFQVFCD